MDKKQTAVDWLVEQIFNDVDLKDGILKLAIQQAKEMEMDQIMIASAHSHFEGGNYKISGLELFQYSFKYYTSTYGK